VRVREASRQCDRHMGPAHRSRFRSRALLSSAIVATIVSEELAASITPIMGYCIEQFRPDRCMFESNFPVDKVGSPPASARLALGARNSSRQPPSEAIVHHAWLS
jgi:predicted TIM-barrel fold metal-dependent hydrolase